jgi:hypothetical protein
MNRINNKVEKCFFCTEPVCYLPFPFSHPKVAELNDKHVRGIHVQADRGRDNYAKDFPFKLVYKIYPGKDEIVIYQLWQKGVIKGLINWTKFVGLH